jgi:type 1 glutamine amidotransferase
MTIYRTHKHQSSKTRLCGLHSACIGLLLSLAASPLLAQPILDCPLRDMPFSLASPFLDILLSPQAKTVVDKHLPTLLEKAPPFFTRTEVPTFSAIVSLQGIVGMMRLPTDTLEPLAAELAQLEVTDQDRRARCARYDNDQPKLNIPTTKVRILVFDKINGFDHGPSVTAATHAVSALAEQLGWGVTLTGSGGAFNPDTLAQFDLVVWNNNSGDMLTLSQRQAFEDYINGGGGFLGIHGSGGDSSYYWDWYAQQLVGAQFIGHPLEPQLQNAVLHIESTRSGIGAQLKPSWSMKDEWYSFAASPRASGANVVATLNESTYVPEGMGKDLRMGKDHPIVWTRCVGDGRSFYSAIGHRPEVYHLPENLMLLRDGLRWAAGQSRTDCKAGREIKRKQR